MHRDQSVREAVVDFDAVEGLPQRTLYLMEDERAEKVEKWEVEQ